MLHAGTKPGGGAKEVGAKDYPEAGDLVILYTGHSNLQTVYLDPGKLLQNKHGNFLHDELLRTKYGTKVYSRDRRGFVMMLRPTAELWTQALPHRTQIVYNADISYIIFRLEIRPGHTVVESGTGSGSMTSSLARVVGPKGKVYSLDFHQQRVEQAAEEFAQHGLAEIIDVKHADVYADGFKLPEGVFADAIFLDLPNPWHAVKHAHAALKDRAGVCSFSPCMEQVEKTCTAMRDLGFTDITTVEVLVRHWDIFRSSVDIPNFDALDTSSEYRALGTHAMTKKRKAPEGGGEGRNAGAEEDEEEGRVMRPALRPRDKERGHTSFLTFARRGVRAEAASNRAAAGTEAAAGGAALAEEGGEKEKAGEAAAA